MPRRATPAPSSSARRLDDKHAPDGEVTFNPNPPPFPPFPPPAPAPRGHVRFPRHIWTYWDTEEYPELVAACFAMFRIYNPGYTVTILHENTTLLPPPPVPQAGPPLTAQQKADWYRINALADFGGIWMDSSNIVVQSIEHWVNVSALELQGFNMPANARFNSEEIMENWAMASPTDCAFTKAWRDEFKLCLETGAEQFVAAQDPAVLGSLANNSYLDQHVSWVLTREAHPDYPYSLLSSTDYGRPFYYQMKYQDADGTWDSCKAANEALYSPPPHATAFLKFRGAERGCTGALWTYGGGSLGNLLLEALHSQPDLLAASQPPPSWTGSTIGYWFVDHEAMTLWILFCVVGIVTAVVCACNWDSILRALHRRGYCLSCAERRTLGEVTRLKGAADLGPQPWAKASSA